MRVYQINDRIVELEILGRKTRRKKERAEIKGNMDE